MGAAYFYHLTRRSLEETLPILLARSLDAGWRVVVRGQDVDRMAWLDERLWHGPDDGFLPHGLAGGAFDADQPILLTTQPTRPNDPACLMSVDGAEVTAQDVAALDRVCILFNGDDPPAVDVARRQWKRLTDAGCSAQYWSEESGRWEKKAEK